MNIKNLLNGDVTQQDLLNYYNANISYKEMPEGINGFVFQYNNIYNIFINEELSYYKRRKTIVHELAHIELNHLCQKDCDLFALKKDKYEDEADRYIKELLKGE